ncbi:MAG: PHA/PHB synthase family protein [Alphaproteobacteria bacterium]
MAKTRRKRRQTATGAQASEATSYRISDPAEFTRNMARVAVQGSRLIADFVRRQSGKVGHEPFDPLNISGAFLEFLGAVAADPRRFAEAQYALWRDHATLWGRTAQRLIGQDVEPMIVPASGDRRFRDKDWQENIIFDFIKQSYLLTANWIQRTAAKTGNGDTRARQRIDFYAKQFADAVAPTNFVLTNPEVLRETLSSNGENLVRGLKNLLADLERGDGQLLIRQTADAFEVGKNIALTPGKAVFRNALMELIQYTPATKSVHKTPLLIIPPWINKFYILDLRPENSLVKWIVERGYTVFLVSWVNPAAKLANKSFEDYMREGIFAALSAVQMATGEDEINTVGYCIGGTLLGASLAYMAAAGDSRIKSATFLAAQLDFSEAGQLQVFVDDKQIRAVDAEMREAGGVLPGSRMATTFNMLRANDLIWSFVVNNYLMGREPPPFDLLYWNSDTTRMPRAMHLFYLRECYLKNNLAQGKMVLGGERLDLSKVKTPSFFQAAKEDHIAPAISVYYGVQLFRGSVAFILAGSGHIAGVINPPAAQKYQHWTNEKLPREFGDWQLGASEHAGSWWPYWEKWLAARSGKKVPARRPGGGKLKILGNAPGTYVKVKAR